MLSNRLAADLTTKWITQGSAMLGENSPWEKDKKLSLNAPGIEPFFNELNKGDWQANMVAFNAQWERLLQELGNPLVKPAIEILRQINSALSSLGQFAGAHPEGIKIAMEGIAVIGSALVVGGIVAVFTALAPLAGAAAGVAALAAALGTLAALNYGSLTGFFKSSVDLGMSFVSGKLGIELGLKLGAMWHDAYMKFITSIPGTFQNVAMSLVHGLTDSINSFIAGIPGAFAGIGQTLLNALKSAIGIGAGGSGTEHQGSFSPGMESTPGGAATGGTHTGKRSEYNAVPPASNGGGGNATHVTMQIDGRVLGEATARTDLLGRWKGRVILIRHGARRLQTRSSYNGTRSRWFHLHGLRDT
jgi:hypothetical protein